jgi:hypothetical protein
MPSEREKATSRNQEPPSVQPVALDQPGDDDDQPEDDDYIRRLIDRIAPSRIKFSLGGLMFVVTCLGVVFAGLQFAGPEDMPHILFGFVVFALIVLLIAKVITPKHD